MRAPSAYGIQGGYAVVLEGLFRKRLQSGAKIPLGQGKPEKDKSAGTQKHKTDLSGHVLFNVVWPTNE